MRRKDRETARDFAISVVDKCEWATMAMTDGGAPYCVTLSIVRKGESIYFHSAMNGRKIDCLKNSPNVCLSCIGETHRADYEFTTEYESAVVFGTAIEVTETEEKIDALRLLCLRHTPANMTEFDGAIVKSLHRTAVWKIDIHEITGKCKKINR